MQAIGAPPARMLTSKGWSSFTATKLAKVCAAPTTISVSLFGPKWPDDAEVSVHLRDKVGSERYTTSRRAALFSPSHLGIADEGILEFLRVAVSEYPVVQGGACLVPSRYHADAEGCLHLSNEIDRATYDRVSFDGLNVRAAMHLGDRVAARRLYPVTIFGPALWATLPPLPKLDPMPKVTDLGDCKLLTAWPELVAPHDPAFLAGTKELRRWLWPHTIQNPADDPARV